jgi:hypothetical protein
MSCIQLSLRGNSRTLVGEYTIGSPEDKSPVCLSLPHILSARSDKVMSLLASLDIRVCSNSFIKPDSPPGTRRQSGFAFGPKEGPAEKHLPRGPLLMTGA